MNCEKCPHMVRLRDALAPCQNCDRGHSQRAADTYCETRCPHFKAIADASKPCQNCDAGKVGISCHVSEARMDYALIRSAAERRGGGGAAGCTMLAGDVERDLRLALATVVGKIEYRDADTALALLKGGRLGTFAKFHKMTRREFVDSAHRVLDVFKAATALLTSDESRAAAKTLAGELCKMNALKDGVTLLAVFRGDTSVEFARRAGLKNRQAAHARIVSLLMRFPPVAEIYGRDRDLVKHLPLADGWRSCKAAAPISSAFRRRGGFVHF